MIQARGLTKRYGRALAVDGLTFDVVPGRVTGFLGPNGAGKRNLGETQFFPRFPRRPRATGHDTRERRWPLALPRGSRCPSRGGTAVLRSYGLVPCGDDRPGRW